MLMKRTLGHSRIEVSALGLGCWAIGGPFLLDGKPDGWGTVGIAGAPAVRPNQPFLLELIECRPDYRGLLRRHIPDMKLIQVDEVGFQATQRGLAGPANVIGRGLGACDFPPGLVVAIPKFRGDDHIVPLTFDRLAEDAFAVARTVHVRGVKQGYPQLDCPSNCTDRT